MEHETEPEETTGPIRQHGTARRQQLPAVHGELPLDEPPAPPQEPEPPRAPTRWEQPLYRQDEQPTSVFPPPAPPQPAAQQQPRPPVPVTPLPWWRRHLLRNAALLLAVAVLAGLVWWLTHQGDGGSSESPTSQPSTRGGEFGRALGPIQDANCPAHSYGTAKAYLNQHRCSSMTRSVYTSTDSSGAKVATSVSIVTMLDSADAQGLRKLTDADGTGNITDLLTDGSRIPEGPASTKGGGYASAVEGPTVAVAESVYFDGHSDDAALTDISRRALDSLR